MNPISSIQRYISNELTHFLGKELRTEEEQYYLFLKILRDGWLTHPPHNPMVSGGYSYSSWNSLCTNEMFEANVICFCDIPLFEMRIHINKYSPFGLSFRKSFLVEKGANPVLYISKNSIVVDFDYDLEDETYKRINYINRCQFFDDKLGDFMELFIHIEEVLKERNENNSKEYLMKLFKLKLFMHMHLFCFIKFFDDTKTDDDPDNFYMEREWRLIGNLNFELNDVQRVILPETYGHRFRQDIPDFYGQINYAD